MVIIELGLSGMDAFAVARSLRAQTNHNVMVVSIMYGDTKHDPAEWEACFDDHVNKLHGMPLLMRGRKKLAEESPEDWVLSERIHRASDRAFVLKMLEAAAGRFSPAELAPSIPEEFLREVRRLAESPSDLANYLGHGGARPKQSGKPSRKRPDEALRRRYLAEYQKAVLDGASRWSRFFNP
jgi:hypothetical protein